MLRVSIRNAKPGMVLAAPVHHPEHPAMVLLRAGVRLDAHKIERLGEIHLHQLWVRYPGVDYLADYVSPAVMQAQAALRGRIAEVVNTIARDAHASLEYADYHDAITALIERLMERPKAALFLDEMAAAADADLRHACTVCTISLCMGLKLQDYIIGQRRRLSVSAARDVSHLAVGAMMHDAGMLRLDPQTRQRWNQTHDENDPRWREHVTIGHDLVAPTIGPCAAAAVLHHHQKYDGSGFPPRTAANGSLAPLAGSEIHVFARIVAAADLFDRLRRPPGSDPMAPPLPTVRVLRTLLGPPYRGWLDPMAVKALLAVVPAYVPGSLVGLSDGRDAAVVGWRPEHPCRPIVQPIEADRIAGVSARTPFRRTRPAGPEADRVDLLERRDLTIVRAEDADVTHDNFFPAHAGEFDLRAPGDAAPIPAFTAATS